MAVQVRVSGWNCRGVTEPKSFFCSKEASDTCVINVACSGHEETPVADSRRGAGRRGHFSFIFVSSLEALITHRKKLATCGTFQGTLLQPLKKPNSNRSQITVGQSQQSNSGSRGRLAGVSRS